MMGDVEETKFLVKGEVEMKVFPKIASNRSERVTRRDGSIP
jgi:hypothetical protein